MYVTPNFMVFTVLVFSFQPSEAFADGPAPAQSNPIAQLYRQNCVQCHGADGKGVPEVRKTMPTLPDFTDSAWQCAQNSALLVMSVLDGKNNLMPAWWGKVSDKQAKELVDYVPHV